MDHLAEHGNSCTVPELAAAAGISERTFYRYFQSREELLGPALQDAQNLIAERLDETDPKVPIGEALLAAWRTVADGTHRDRTRALLPVVLSDPGFHAVWALELRHPGDRLVATVGRHLDCSLRIARVTVMVFLSLVDLALADMVQTGADPSDAIRLGMQVVSAGMFDRADDQDSQSGVA